MKLIGEGWLLKDVAESLGVSQQSVSKWKRLAGKRGPGLEGQAAAHPPVSIHMSIIEDRPQ